MFRTLKNLVALTALLLINVTAAEAAGNIQNATAKKASAQQYALSAVLRKNDQTSTIKLVQSIEVASSKEEATGMFIESIKREIKGYSVLETLVNPILESKKGCETWI